MQRVHISPRLGTKPVTEVKIAHVEATAASMLDSGLAPKTVRNVLTFLHSVFEHAIDRGLISENPVRRATRPGRRRPGRREPRPAVPFRRGARRSDSSDPRRRGRSHTEARQEGEARAGASSAARRPRTRVARADPCRRHNWSAPVRAAWPALARRRLDDPAHPRPQRVRSGRAPDRRQVGSLDPPVSADGRPARRRA
jgi:hypothetical protein